MKYDFLVLGGGAAGFFAAINTAMLKPNLKIAIIEKNREVLQKVKVSGGGRCNVTNVISNPLELVNNYPRGASFLRDAFGRFGSLETQHWFEKQGVILKSEPDGRVFPISNSSQTIIDCFKNLLKKYKIELFTLERVENIAKTDNGWLLKTQNNIDFETNKLMIASGSDNRVWDILHSLGHNIIPAVPSLFTFNIKDAALQELQGVSFKKAEVKIKNTDLESEGPFLITHWGVSGPAILKLSAWGARKLAELNYDFKVEINWLPEYNTKELLGLLKENINSMPKKTVIANPLFDITSRFWKYICTKSEISEQQNWAEMGKKKCLELAQNLTACNYKVTGKSTFKEEFVTAGGIDLDEVSNIDFGSKIHQNLFFSGEVLDIDAITGGFNFQAAWTGAWCVSQHFKV